MKGREMNSIIYCLIWPSKSHIGYELFIVNNQRKCNSYNLNMRNAISTKISQ